MSETRRPKVDIVVLLAGEGKRLRPLTKDRPKALLCCEGGISIFHNLVKAVVAQPWDATIIPVIGHGRHKVHEEMDALANLVKFDHVHNPFYATAGPLASLWLGVLQAKNEHLLVVNGDTLVKESLVEKLVPWLQGDNAQGEVSLCVSNSDEFEPDDMKVAVDAQGAFVATGKDIDPSSRRLKSAGVMALRGKENKDILKARLDQMVMDPQRLTRKYYWHNVLDEVKDDFKIDLIPVAADSWYEIDTRIDFKTMVASADS